MVSKNIGAHVDSNCYNEFYGHLIGWPETDYLIALGQLLQIVNQRTNEKKEREKTLKL